MTALLNDFLKAMDQIVLEATDLQSDQLRLIQGESKWSTFLFPELRKSVLVAIDERVPFLHDFLHDARIIWSSNTNKKLKSGLFTEDLPDGSEVHLEATAIKQDSHCFLLIANQSEEFSFRQNTLQAAREMLLSNDRLIEQNEYLHNRLLNILKDPLDNNQLQKAISSVIENAEFGVLITDANMSHIIENTAAINIFEQPVNPASTPEQPLDIVLGLLENQVPEFERVVSTKSDWDGELCWMAPPTTVKWLKLSIHPVKNDLNEVKQWIIFVNDISTVKHLVQRNEQLALQDLLTELPNRYSFWQTLEQQINNQSSFYLLYVDINEFRKYNEFYGHDEGDHLLRDIGQRIQRSIKNYDFVARIGGDQFAIILTDMVNEADCQKAISRLIAVLSSPFTTQTGQLFNITISIGAVSYPRDAESVAELMRFVDLSAHNNKNKKQTYIQFYNTELKAESHREIELENELRLAIMAGEFELYFQPIIDLAEDKVVKAEALIRWNHPQKGLVNPDTFIPIAEKSELIITLGKWVISRACQVAKEFADNNHEIKVSMNLSPSQVYDEDLYNYLCACIKKYNVDPKLLEIEVTEGVLVENYTNTDLLLNKIREFGLTVSVDDFGTGYSSLSYLKKLPIDYLKIDRSFVQDIATDDNDKAIVKAVIGMAHNLNLKVIAEGVETTEQLKFLIDNHCNSVQGYLFSRPIQLDSFMELLDEKTITTKF